MLHAHRAFGPNGEKELPYTVLVDVESFGADSDTAAANHDIANLS